MKHGFILHRTTSEWQWCCHCCSSTTGTDIVLIETKHLMHGLTLPGMEAMTAMIGINIVLIPSKHLNPELTPSCMNQYRFNLKRTSFPEFDSVGKQTHDLPLTVQYHVNSNQARFDSTKDRTHPRLSMYGQMPC